MNYRRNSQVSGKLYNWLLYASKWILRYEKCNVKRGKRIGGSKKNLASNRWCSSAEEERWWEGVDRHERFRERHSVE